MERTQPHENEANFSIEEYGAKTSEKECEEQYFATQNPRREFYVGLPSVKAIVANKITPGLLDHYLARTGYGSQQHDDTEDPNRPNNLCQPVPGDHGAHGAFGAGAHHWSPQFWTSKHRGWLASGVVALALTGVLAFLKNR